MTSIEYYIENQMYISGFNTPKEYIEKYDLKSKSRNADKVMQRTILVTFLRKKPYTFETIGKLLNRHYSAVIFMMQNVSSYEKIKDKKYFEALKKYEPELNNLQYEKSY